MLLCDALMVRNVVHEQVLSRAKNRYASRLLQRLMCQLPEDIYVSYLKIYTPGQGGKECVTAVR